jgi:hypothetical protein
MTNPEGHKQTLVAQHSGNLNAVKSGVYSDRLIDTRASEVTDELFGHLGSISPIGSIAVRDAARCIALLDMIDADLERRGVADKKGNARSLIDRRLATSRRLEKLLDRIQAEVRREPIRAERADYVSELQRIALGHDQTARPQDRLIALKELLALGACGTTSYLESEEAVDLERGKAQREVAREQTKAWDESTIDRIERERARRNSPTEQYRRKLEAM